MAETEEERDSESYKKLCRLWDHVRDIEYDREFYRVNDVEKINREMEKIIEKGGGDNNYQFSSDDVITKRNPRLVGCTALHLAAGQNNDTIINVLLSKPAVDFTLKNHTGSTALHEVVEKYYKSRWRSINELSENDIVNAILSAHVKLDVFENPCNKDGISHFHVACMINKAAVVEFFISKGVSVDQVVDGNFSSLLGRTPLHFAVDCCAKETVKILLRHGADVDRKDAKGMSPLQLLSAKIMSNVDLIHTVMSFVHLMNTDSRHSHWRYKLPKLMSDIEADKQMMELLLSHIIGLKNPLEFEDLSVFHVACILQNTSLIEQLLTEIKDINHCVKMDSASCPGYTAAHFAAHFDPNIMKFLTQHGASIEAKDANGVTPLDICLEKYKVPDLHCILSSNSVWRNLVVSDNKTTLLDVVSAMVDSNTLEHFLKGVKSYQSLRVPNDSPLWPGYTLLHLAVNFSETIKIITDFEKNDDDYYEKAEFEKLESEYIERIEICLKYGADITAQNAHGRTALHLAYRLQKSQVVRLLLEQHAEIINSVDDDNLSHLYIACAFNYPRVVEKLLADDESKVNLTIKSTFDWPRNQKYYVRRNSKKLCQFFATIGSTPLHIAVTTAGSEPESVEILLKHGADVNARDSNGVTPLYRTLACENPKSVGQILLSSPDVEECSLRGLSYLHLAAEFGSSEKMIDRLIALGADVNSAIDLESEVEDDLLCLAYYCDHRRHLSEPFAFMSKYKKFRPVDRAIYRNHTEVVTSLLNRGVDILALGPHDRTLLDDALRGGYCSDVILSAIKRDVDLQQRVREATGITMLHLACNKYNLSDLEYCLKNGTDVNARVKFDSPVWPGCTATHVLAWEIWSYRRISNEDKISAMMSLLLANGADVTLLNAEENTPIHLIFMHDYHTTRFSFTELLLESAANSNVNPVDADGISHFHIACLRNNLAIMDKFLRRNVDVNQSVALHSGKFPGCSPLHLVLQSNSWVGDDVRIEAIDLLVRYGADVHAEDLYGNTAFHAATKCAPPRKQLLDRIFSIGTDIRAKNIYDEEPLIMVMSSRTFEYADVKFFLEHNCHPNLYEPIRDQGCLTFLFGKDHPIRKIVKAPSITTIDHLGRNAIHNVVSWEWARTKSYYQIIPMLMVRGCNIDHKDNLGRTPLHLAVKFNNYEAVKDLLGAGANINVNNAEGESPFSHVFSLSENSRYENEYDEIVMSMAMHIRKLQITGLHVNDLNAETLEELLKKRSLDEEKIKSAIGELAKMKDLIIESTQLSPFDFFPETGVIVNFAHMPLSEQQAIDEFFNSMKKRDFLELGYLLKIRYEKTLKRPGCLCFFGKKLIRTVKLLKSNNRKFCV